MNKNDKMPLGSHGNGNQDEATRRVRRSGKHEVNLRKRGFLHFQIGLILAMLLVYAGLEASFRAQKEFTPAPKEAIGEIFVLETQLPPVRVEQEQPTIKKKTVSHTFTPVPDHTELVTPEHVIEVPQPPAANPNLALPDIVYDEPEVEEKVPYIAVEDKPVFPGCEDVEKKEQQACFQKMMDKHIRRNFKYPQIDMDLGTTGKVNVFFIIGKDGTIQDIQLKGPSRTMEKEAKRIIQKLPKMTPGKQRDKPVKVSFYIPINFQLN